jgi:hypothetical protein
MLVVAMTLVTEAKSNSVSEMGSSESGA